jgi:hypothetical protein
MTVASDASIMNRAAVEDLRAVKVWPVIAQVLAGEPAPSALAQQVVDEVSAWSAEGASRRGEKYPKAPAAAALDAMWTPIGEAVLGPVLGELLPRFKALVATDDPPSPTGSAYDNGWYGYVYKDLRSVLGEPVAGPFSRGYCGNGNLAACRKSLWAAIQTAVEGVAAKQGPDPTRWRAARVRIEFPPGIIAGYTMRWTNRSTFQQAIEFTGHEGP